jgi:hypothetical protein
MVFLMQELNETAQVHWEIARLLEMGISDELLRNLPPRQIGDLLKVLLYLREKHIEMLD